MSNDKIAEKKAILENLNKSRTPAERVESAKKAGKASGESRRRAADLKKSLSALLDSKATGFQIPENPVFDKSTDHSVQTAIICALVYRALKGEVSAINAISKLMGLK